MKRAAVVIFPSKWDETFGRVIIEAFAVGTPVIASCLGAAPELITPGQTGYLFDPNSPDALAHTVEDFLRHPDPAAMCRAARNCFEQRYTAAQNHDQLLAIYRRARAANE
jgi:glycosyltransferase involved in cell wall biosynthesis